MRKDKIYKLYDASFSLSPTSKSVYKIPRVHPCLTLNIPYLRSSNSFPGIFPRNEIPRLLELRQ